MNSPVRAPLPSLILSLKSLCISTQKEEISWIKQPVVFLRVN